MATSSRFPELAYPFAVVGAAAGWLSAGFLNHPLIGLAAKREQGVAALLAGAIAAGAGAILTRWSRRPELRDNAVDPWLRLVVALVAAGALSGAAVGGVSLGMAAAVEGSGLGGLVCACAFLPVGALVLAAARRAQRARLGSIVAGADRRAVWGILVTSLAVTTLAALPDWPAFRAGDALGAMRSVPEPTVARWMACAAGLLIAAIALIDVIALARVGYAATREGMERRDAGDLEGGGEGVPRVDLGLGDDLLASLTRVSTAYRARERAISLVVGSPDLARAALRWALARGALGLAVVGGVLWLHASMARESATIAYLHGWCEKGILRACIAEADRLDQQGDTARALSIHERMCDAFDTKSCVKAAERRERDDVLDRKAIGLRRQACDGADAASCRVLADRLLISKGADESKVAWLRKRAIWAGER